MRKTKILLLLLCLSAICLLTACNKEHTHEFGEWITVKNATCTEEGERERYCFCLEKETESLAALGHQPSEEASCTKSQHCLVCNAVLVPPKQHRFGNYTVTKSPTCTEKGERERICANCDEKQTQTLYPTGHSHGDWIIVKEVTCEEDGIREQYCACGDKRTSITQALGHNFTDWSVSKEASCTEQGSKERYCSCGKKETQIIPIFHPYNETVLKEATPFEDGLKELNCPLCQKKTEEIIPSIVSNGLAYKINSDGVTCTITGIGTCTDEDVIIPKSIDGYTVTTIGNEAFKDCKTMKLLLIPATVTKIGSDIVSGAVNLTTLYYHSSYKCDYTTFRLSSITKVVYGGTFIGRIKSGLKEVVITGKPTYIDDEALAGCALKSFVVPESVTSIGNSAFRGCSSLTEIVIPEGVTSIGYTAFENCSSLTTVTLPSSVTSIGYAAFNNCRSLTEIVISEGITELGHSLFKACKALTRIEIPSTVTKIDAYAFDGCDSLSEITLPEGLTQIGEGAFLSCDALTVFTVPDGITEIPNYMFQYCEALTDVVIPKSVTKIGVTAFYQCTNLKNITFKGTKAEWEAITKGDLWNQWSGLQTVTCSDGVIGAH